jgi:hypothetical protein
MFRKICVRAVIWLILFTLAAVAQIGSPAASDRAGRGDALLAMRPIGGDKTAIKLAGAEGRRLLV